MYNRRIGKVVDDEGDGVTDLRERYVWDVDAPDGKGNVVLDFVDEDLDGTAAGVELSRRYLWGNAVDQIFAQENVDDLLTADADDVLWTLTDNLGSVRDVAKYDDATDTTSIVEHFTYLAFGEITSGDTTPDGLTTRYLYTAQEYDPHTGEWYYDERWYSSYTASFLSPDPIQDDLSNDYRYVNNSPTTMTDPTGLAGGGGIGGPSFDYHSSRWSSYSSRWSSSTAKRVAQKGVWKAGKSVSSRVLTQTELKARGGKGWFHPHVGKPVQYRGFMDADFTNARVVHEGRTWVVEIEGSGNQTTDLGRANTAARQDAKKIGVKFDTAKAVNGTWHHLDFDPQSGKFLMELVDGPTHSSAIHRGAFDAFLEWAADRLADPPSLRELNTTQRQSIERALDAHPERMQTKMKARKVNLPTRLLQKFVAATEAQAKLDVEVPVGAKGRRAKSSANSKSKPSRSSTSTRSSGLGRVGLGGLNAIAFLSDIAHGVRSLYYEDIVVVHNDRYGSFVYYSLTGYKEYVSGPLKGERVKATPEEHNAIRKQREDYQDYHDQLWRNAVRS